MMEFRQIRRLLVLVTVLMLNVSFSVVATDLKDITVDQWFYEDVQYLVDQGVVGGYEDGTFRANQSVNVDAFVKMLVSAMGYELDNGTTYWASTYIRKAAELGLLNENNFEAYDRPITRGEMAVLAAGTLTQIQTISPYSHFAYEIEDYNGLTEEEQVAVMIAMSQGIITGYDDYTYRAEGQSTRAESAVVIARIIDVTRRQTTNVFELKIDAMKAQQVEFLANTEKMYVYLDQVVDIFAGEDVDVSSRADTYKVVNVLNNYLDVYLKQLLEVTTFEHGPDLKETIVSENVEWLKQRKPGHLQLKAETSPGKTVKIDFIDTVVQLVLIDEYSGITCEFERNEEGQVFYAEFYDAKDKTRVGYKISLVPNSKYEMIRTLDGEKNILAYTLFRNDITVYVDEVEDVIYRVLSDTRSEIEKTVNGHKEIYVYTKGDEIYSDLVDGQLTGRGYQSDLDGVSYIGEFVEGALTGHGTMFFKNGIVLESDFIRFVPTVRESIFTGTDNNIETLTEYMEEVITTYITVDMTRKDKIKAIHDYLVLHIDYAEDTIVDDLSDMDYNNGYTAIMDGSSVCLGYAQAMNLFMNMMGIDSYVVIGDTDKDGVDDHAWNYVYYGGDYRHVDVTWDDPDKGDRIRYDYLMKSDKSIRKERDITEILGWE